MDKKAITSWSTSSTVFIDTRNLGCVHAGVLSCSRHHEKALDWWVHHVKFNLIRFFLATSFEALLPIAGYCHCKKTSNVWIVGTLIFFIELTYAVKAREKKKTEVSWRIRSILKLTTIPIIMWRQVFKPHSIYTYNSM